MAEGILDKLTFLIDGDASGVNEAMSQVEDTFKKGFNNILNNFVAPLTGALAAGRLFSGFTQQADKISKFSKSLGINGQDLQAWGEAATRAGGSAQAFQGSVRMLQRRIAMAGTGAGQGAAMFKKFGISLKDSEGKTKDSFQILSELAAKADKMSNQEFAGMAMALRIDQGTIQLLQKGSKGVAELVDQMRELGTYTEEDYQAAEDYNDAMADFKQATQIAGARVFSALLPPINKMITALAKFVAFLTKNKALIRGAGFAAMAIAISSKLLPMLKKLSTALNLKSSFGSWAKLAAVFTTLYLIVEDFVVWLKGGKSALAGFWEMFGTQDEVRKKFEKLRDMVKNVIDMFGSHSGTVKKFFVLFAGVSSVFVAVSAFKKLHETLSAVATGFKAAANLAKTNPYVLVAAAIAAALLLVIENWDAIKEAMLSCWEALKNTWGTFSGWFKNVWQSAIDGLSGIIPDWLKKLLSGIKIGTTDNGANIPTNTNSMFQSSPTGQADMKTLAPMANPAAAAVAAIPPRSGENNTTVNNSREIRINTVNVKGGKDVDELVDNVENVATRKSGDATTDTAYGVAMGQNSK